MTERRKIWALVLAAAATGLGAALAWAAPEPARVSTVALGEPSGGRVVLELNRRVDHRAFLLDEPMRLVVDLADATWSLGRAPAAGGMVAGYRYGQGDAQHARLVIDLAQPARGGGGASARGGRAARDGSGAGAVATGTGTGRGGGLATDCSRFPDGTQGCASAAKAPRLTGSSSTTRRGRSRGLARS